MWDRFEMLLIIKTINLIILFLPYIIGTDCDGDILIATNQSLEYTVSLRDLPKYLSYKVTYKNDTGVSEQDVIYTNTSNNIKITLSEKNQIWNTASYYLILWKKDQECDKKIIFKLSHNKTYKSISRSSTTEQTIANLVTKSCVMNFNESEKCLVPSEKKSVVAKKTEENSCDKDPEQSRQLPNASQVSGNKKSMNIIITAVTIVIVVLVVLIILLRLFIRRRKGLVEKSCHEENENPQNLYVEIHETNKKIKYGANAGKSEVQYAELMLRESQNKEPELVQDKIIYSKIAGVILPRDRKSEK